MPRLWAGLAIVFLLLGGLLMAVSVGVVCPKVIQPLFEKLGHEKFQLLFKARIWVVAVANLLFGLGLLCATGFIPRSRMTIRWVLTGTVLVLIVAHVISAAVFLTASPKQVEEVRWTDTGFLLWLLLVVTGSVTMGVVFLGFRGWLRWTGIALSALVFGMMVIEWVYYVSHAGSKSPVTEASRWAWWSLSVATILLKWGGSLLPAVCVMFKPSLAADAPATGAARNS